MNLLNLLNHYFRPIHISNDQMMFPWWFLFAGCCRFSKTFQFIYNFTSIFNWKENFRPTEILFLDFHAIKLKHTCKYYQCCTMFWTTWFFLSSSIWLAKVNWRLHMHTVSVYVKIGTANQNIYWFIEWHANQCCDEV